MNELIEKYEREIERLDADMRDDHDNGFRSGKLAVLVMVVADLKAMQRELKKGHWIDIFGGYECSECGCLEAGYSDYCPNCGAKMQEVQE